MTAEKPDPATADYLAMYTDLLIAIGAQLTEVNKGLGLLREAVTALGTLPAPVPAPLPQPAQAAPAGPFPPIGGWKCPTHNLVKTVPAGISKKTGKAYDAFLACPEYGCSEKPPRVVMAAPARAVPPSEMP